MPDLDRIHKTAAAYDAILHRKSPPPTMRELHEAQAAMNRALNDKPDPEPIKIPTAEDVKKMQVEAAKERLSAASPPVPSVESLLSQKQDDKPATESTESTEPPAEV